MSFVHPLLLGGLLLVGIPVLVHLIMRQKPKHLLFPAFRFLLQRHRTNQRKLQLRHLLLLALRMLLIAAVCLALARPKIFSQRLNLTGNRPRAVVLVFDTSYSMQYTSGGQTRLDEAKRRSLELLSELPDGSRVAVLDSAEPGGEWLSTVSLARERIGALQLRAVGDPVSRRLPLAYDLLDKVGQDQDNPEERPLPFLYVFSDRTQACWDAGQLEDLQRLRDRVPGVHAVFVDVGVPKPADLAVTKVELSRAMVVANRPVVIRATVQATGTGCDTALTCRIDGEKTPDRKPVKLGPGESQVIAFERVNLPPGYHQAEIRLEAADETLPFNNVRYVTFEIRQPRQVLIIADATADVAPWQLALEANGPFPCACDRRSPQQMERLVPQDLARYQAVCLFDVARPTPDLWDKLAAYVGDGGGLAVMPGGAEVDREAYNGSPSVRQLLPGRLNKIVTAKGDRGIPWRWKDTTYQHPLFKPFLEWNRNPDIAFVRFPPTARRYWGVQPYAAGSSTLITYADPEDRPAILERVFDREKTRGRVLLFTTPLDRRTPAWNDYGEVGLAFYEVLAQLAVGAYLAGDAEEATFNYLCGQSVPVALSAKQRFATYTVDGPGLSGADAIVQRSENAGELHLTQAVLPGNYKVFGGDNVDLVAGFSLNVPPEESQLSPVPAEQIEALFGPNSVLPLDRKADLRQALDEHWVQPLELFPWLMILLLVLLAAESLLANKFYRREPAPGSAGPGES